MGGVGVRGECGGIGVRGECGGVGVRGECAGFHTGFFSRGGNVCVRES